MFCIATGSPCSKKHSAKGRKRIRAEIEASKFTIKTWLNTSQVKVSHVTVHMFHSNSAPYVAAEY